MKLPRRNFLRLAAGAAALPAASRIVWAQTYPTRPVRIIAPTAPAGAPDVLARLFAPWLSERLGQQFVVENRPGSGSNIGTEAVVRAPPDGYTLLIVSSANTINATLYDKLNFIFLRDIAPVAGLISLPFVMVVNPSVPAKTVAEFTAYAKANPGKISVGSPGIGTPGHVAGELFKMMAGVELIHVPYRGGGAVLSDLIGGQVQVLFGTTSLTVEQIRAGKLRPLAVTSATRWEGLPDIPTVGDFIPGYEASSLVGLGAPKRTPVEIIDKLNREINAALDDPKLKARLIDLGGTLIAGSPADFGKLIAEDTEKWGKVIRAANIKADQSPAPTFHKSRCANGWWSRRNSAKLNTFAFR
jgi:tripartite-type tricarboxylate transporter receptor subunit TctC